MIIYFPSTCIFTTACGIKTSTSDIMKISWNPKTGRRKMFVIYEEGVVEFYINVYKTAKSYNEKVLKVTDEKFIKIFLEQNLKDGDYLFSKENGRTVHQIQF